MNLMVDLCFKDEFFFVVFLLFVLLNFLEDKMKFNFCVFILILF